MSCSNKDATQKLQQQEFQQCALKQCLQLQIYINWIEYVLQLMVVELTTWRKLLLITPELQLIVFKI